MWSPLYVSYDRVASSYFLAAFSVVVFGLPVEAGNMLRGCPVVTLPAHRYKDRPSLDAIPDGFAIEERGTPLARTLRRASRTAREASSDHPSVDVGETAPETRKKDKTPDGPPYVWSFDIDDTITSAPQRYSRLAHALRDAGDKIVCVTGHGPMDTRIALLDALDFPYDDIIIVDPGEFGKGKAKALKKIGAFMHFDDRVEFGPEIIKVCPVAFQYVEPPGDKASKKAAKKAADDLNQ